MKFNTVNKIPFMQFGHQICNIAIMQYEYVWLAVVENPYFENLINFITWKFDKPEYADTIIVTVGDFYEVIKKLRKEYPSKRIIAYNWEQLCGGNDWMGVDYMCSGIKTADEIWDYNYLNAKYMELYHGITDCKIYPFEYFSEIETLNNKENPEIDVLFCGLLNPRRSKIFANIHRGMYNKFNIVLLLGATVEESHKYMENSKIVLNIHAFEPYSRQEQERIGFLLGNKKCVVSEWSQENYFSGAIIEASPSELCVTLAEILKEDKWKKQAELGYNMFKNGLCEKTMNENFR